MKCSDCGTEIKDLKRKYRELSIKKVRFKAKTIICPKCGQDFIAEEDLNEAIENYEVACMRKGVKV